MRRCTSFLLPVLLSLAPAAALAQTTDPYLATHHSVILGNLCVGVSCGNLVTDDDDDLRLTANVVSLLFRDTSDEPNFPTNDWRLVANDPGAAPFGPEYFGIQDVDGDTIPFRVKAGAPNHALVISPEGHIGLGTLSPETDVHIVSGDTPSILLAQDGSQGFPAQNWIVGGHNDAFILRDVTAGTWPVSVGTGAATHSLVLTTNNRTGLGIFEPEAAVHLFRDNGEAKILVQEINDNPSPRTLLELKNNGRPEIVLANTDTGGEWSFGAGTRFILKHGAVGSTSNAKAKLFEVTDAGDAIRPAA
ncbi:MAG: hypothetical protein R3D85_13320 [Paracoccaceae bacterium]